jgi:peptidoglycan hydrolase-like protein with peptidoglycan-binding domain
VFESSTTLAVQEYQAANGLARTGVVTDEVWAKLRTGTV